MDFKKLNRRDFLKMTSTASAGAFLAGSLPIYRTFAASGATPMRLLIVSKYFGWTIRQDNEDEIATVDAGASLGFRLPDYMSSLNPYKEHVTIIENLRGTNWGNAHDHSYANILTNACVENEMSSAELLFNSPLSESFDWYLGKKLDARVARIANTTGRHPLCFDDRGTAIRPIEARNLEQLYKELITPILNFQAGGNPDDLKAKQINAEVFKLLGQDVNILKRLITREGTERSKIFNFEKSIQQADPANDQIKSVLKAISDPGKFSGDLGNPIARLEYSLQMMKLAFLADTHRIGVMETTGDLPVSVLKWTDKSGTNHTGMDLINQSWTATGSSPADNNFHHLVSHYKWGLDRGDINPMLCMKGSNKMFFDAIGRFVQDLATTNDADGQPLLENTCIMLTGEISTGNHDRRRKPIILIGGRGKGIRSGRIIRGEQKIGTSTNLKTLTRGGDLVPSGWSRSGSLVSMQTQGDVFVSLARLMGVPTEYFGFKPQNSTPFKLT